MNSDDKEKRKYYLSMLNILYGLQDDMDANSVPEEAKVLLAEVVEICQSDFRVRFPA